MLNVSEIVQTIKQLIEVRIQMVKSQLEDSFSEIISRVFILILMGLASLMILLFASISLAFYLGEILYSNYQGFLYVSLIYLVIFVILFLIRESDGIITSFRQFFRRFLFRIKKQ
ncbi:phage holin family protein [Belliella kenyensis]|uniref:Phage holin family protein n=1 Tax=Belliella kenyensis TaxID=1472724 RepID=A0ABV8EK17_9BACT|nr:phage holin family protein [Belliella kenyensis]MCH7403314.1 phage holin family protein [Belliella kenyensis]MDN3602955.1 phage holin family protein [Belliella kenyensis]